MPATGGSGFTVKLYASTNTTYTSGTQLGNITSVTIGDEERTAIDITSTDSSGGFMEFVQGLINPGSITLDTNYYGGASGTQSYANIRSLFAVTTSLYWTIVGAGGGGLFQVQGFMTRPGNIAFPIDGKAAITGITIKASGAPTFTTAAA